MTTGILPSDANYSSMKEFRREFQRMLYRHYTWNLWRCIGDAGALTHAYQQGEADAWIAADKHYAKEACHEYNEGYEAGRAVAAREYQSYNW